MWSPTLVLALLAAPSQADAPPRRAALGTGVMTSLSAVGLSVGGLALGGGFNTSGGLLTDEEAAWMVVGMGVGHAGGIELGTRWSARRYAVDQKPLRRGAWLGTAAGLGSAVLLLGVPSSVGPWLGAATYVAGPGAGASWALNRSGPTLGGSPTGGRVPSLTIQGVF